MTGRNVNEEFFAYEPMALQDSEDEERKDREKQERIEASIKKREEEVQRTLSTSLRERDKEREQHKKDEAIQHFNALLADLVSWAAMLHIKSPRSPTVCEVPHDEYPCVATSVVIYLGVAFLQKLGSLLQNLSRHDQNYFMGSCLRRFW